MRSKNDRKRYEKCTKCGKDWNISINKKIPKRGYVCPRCKQPKFIKAAIYIGLFIIGAVLCKHGVEEALIERGRFAIGGEWLLIVLLAFTAYTIESIYAFMKDFFEECAEFENEVQGEKQKHVQTGIKNVLYKKMLNKSLD